MLKNIISLFSIVLTLSTAAHAGAWNVYDTTAIGAGCTAGIETYSTGFNAKFYDYAAGDLVDINDDNYVGNSYQLGTVRTSTTGVTEPNFSFADGIGGKEIYSMYDVDMWNVLIELKGYFVAPETGLYEVTVQNADDAVFVWLGSGAFDCCSQESVTDSFNDVLLADRNDGTRSSYVYLDEGMFYPMRVNYINVWFGAEMQFEIVAPSGNIFTNFNETVINFETSDIAACADVNYGQEISVSKETIFTDIASASTKWNQVIANDNGHTSTGLAEQIYFPAPASTVTSVISNTVAATTTVTQVRTVDGTSTAVAVVVEQVSAPESELTHATSNVAVTATVTGQIMPYATGCSINTDSASIGQGFHATLYSYNNLFGFLEPTYYANEYTTEVQIGTASSITEPNFSVQAWLGNTDTIYGAKFDSWKGYVAQLTGYIKAKESGLYEFSVNYSDDGSMVWIGNNDAFACCEPDNIPYNSEDGALFFAHDAEKVNGYVHLDEGYYYPIRIVLVNWYGNSELDISMVTPSGGVVTENWADWIVSLDDESTGFCSA